MINRENNMTHGQSIEIPSTHWQAVAMRLAMHCAVAHTHLQYVSGEPGGVRYALGELARAEELIQALIHTRAVQVGS